MQGSRYALWTEKDNAWRNGPFSLQSICLEILASHLEYIIETESERDSPEILPYLPVVAKAALMAVARRKKCLTDYSLSLLFDDDLSILDLSKSKVTQKGFMKVLGESVHNNVVWMDLYGIKLDMQGIRGIAAACPYIEFIRVGGFTSVTEEESFGLELLEILECRKICDNNTNGVETWDDLNEDFKPGNLVNLKAVVWPNIPSDIESEIGRISPGILLNPLEGSIKNSNIPWFCLTPEYSLDEPAFRKIANFESFASKIQIRERCDLLHQDTKNVNDDMHIAEKFKKAYEDRAKRLKAASKRLRKQEARKWELSLGAAEKAIRDWELAL